MNRSHVWNTAAVAGLLILLATATLLARPAKVCVSCRGDLGCAGGVDQCAEVRCDDGTWYSCLGVSRLP